jgi:hypothetical protein
MSRGGLLVLLAHNPDCVGYLWRMAEQPPTPFMLRLLVGIERDLDGSQRLPRALHRKPTELNFLSFSVSWPLEMEND